jgi:hypothetical protein
MAQHIHSFRARGVISSHAARALGAEARDFRKSAGSLCAVPSEIFLVINLYYQLALVDASMRVITFLPIVLCHFYATRNPGFLRKFFISRAARPAL